MKIRSKIFLMEISRNWEKHLEVLALGTLCPKISFLAQKLQALAREQTDTHAHTHTRTQRKQNLETPFFCNYFLNFDSLQNKNQKHMQK